MQLHTSQLPELLSKPTTVNKEVPKKFCSHFFLAYPVFDGVDEESGAGEPVWPSGKALGR